MQLETAKSWNIYFVALFTLSSDTHKSRDIVRYKGESQAVFAIESLWVYFCKGGWELRGVITLKGLFTNNSINCNRISSSMIPFTNIDKKDNRSETSFRLWLC